MNNPARFLDHFDKPQIETDPADVLVFACLRNERARLPHFLDYYRRLGVAKFFMVDNDSDDGSTEFLLQQPDVVYFHTGGSYRGSGAGRDWTQELAHHYGQGRWCLVLDVDELLVYPGSEFAGLPTLCRFLDAEGSTGLFCVFLDMYSDRPLSQTVYTPPEPFRDVCPYYEIDTYRIDVNASPPFLSIYGGPRWRTFWQESHDTKGPAMRKVPLLKWSDSTHYVYSTHSHSDQPLSLVTGALLHFKFFSQFSELAPAEAARGDRRQGSDYARYAATIEEDPVFIGPQSRSFTGTGDLVRNGVLAAPREYIDWVRDAVPASRTFTSVAFPHPAPGHGLDPSTGKYSIASIGRLWPIVNAAHRVNVGLKRRFGLFSPATICGAIGRLMSVYDIRGDDLVLGIGEEAWEMADGGQIVVIVRRSDAEDIELPLDRSCTARIWSESIIPNALQLALPPGEGARTVASDTFQILLELRTAGGRRATTQLLAGRGHPCPEERYNGVCDGLVGGIARGWIFDELRLTWRVPLVAYAGEAFLGRHVPKTRRPDLRRRHLARDEQGEVREVETTGLGYKIAVPSRFLGPERPTSLELRPAFSTYNLRRTPIPALRPDLQWDKAASVWTADL